MSDAKSLTGKVRFDRVRVVEHITCSDSVHFYNGGREVASKFLGRCEVNGKQVEQNELEDLLEPASKTTLGWCKNVGELLDYAR